MSDQLKDGREYFGLYLPKELKRRIDGIAKANFRSTSKQVEMILTENIGAYEEPKPTKSKLTKTTKKEVKK